MKQLRTRPLVRPNVSDKRLRLEDEVDDLRDQIEILKTELLAKDDQMATASEVAGHKINRIEQDKMAYGQSLDNTRRRINELKAENYLLEKIIKAKDKVIAKTKPQQRQVVPVPKFVTTRLIKIDGYTMMLLMRFLLEECDLAKHEVWITDDNDMISAKTLHKGKPIAIRGFKKGAA